MGSRFAFDYRWVYLWCSRLQTRRDAARVELCDRRLDRLDAVRRARVRAEHLRRRATTRLAREDLLYADHRAGVVTCLGHEAHAKRVRLQFVLAPVLHIDHAADQLRGAAPRRPRRRPRPGPPR